MLPWMVLKAGQYDESKHKRGDSKNAGHFSSGGGGAKKPASRLRTPSQGKPQVGAKPGMVQPSAGITTPGKGSPPATPYKAQPAGMPPLPQQQQAGGQPHEKTMQAAQQAGNAALQEAASGQPGPAKAAFRKALHAHYAAGVMALQKMANEKYGPGPKADAARKQAEQVFVGKIRTAWAKVNQPQHSSEGFSGSGQREPYNQFANDPLPGKKTPEGYGLSGSSGRESYNPFANEPLPSKSKPVQGYPLKKSLGDSLITKSAVTFDLTVELPLDVPAWLRKRK